MFAVETIFPLTRSASPEMVCVPVKYVPLAMVWFVVVGVIVAAPFVVTLAVSETVAVLDVALET